MATQRKPRRVYHIIRFRSYTFSNKHKKCTQSITAAASTTKIDTKQEQYEDDKKNS